MPRIHRPATRLALPPATARAAGAHESAHPAAHDSAHPAARHGLHHDLPRLLAAAPRRQMLLWLGGLGLGAGLSACGGGSSADDTAGSGSSGSSSGGSSSGGSSSGSSGSGTSTTGSCSTIPSETAGPYPGDGTNTAPGLTSNVLAQSGVVRRDIRASFGSATGMAPGVPLTVTITLVNSAASCVPLAGRAVYLWHCDRGGNYSLYSSGVTQENFLRGVQVSDANGQLSFQTIVPGCYSGRWPHMHFEVFPSLDVATSGAADIKTSQIALPQAVCRTVYANATGYAASLANLAGISLASDNIFSDDGAALQMATVSGDTTSGYTATLTVAVAV